MGKYSDAWSGFKAISGGVRTSQASKKPTLLTKSINGAVMGIHGGSASEGGPPDCLTVLELF
jgi:hypothetical protein